MSLINRYVCGFTLAVCLLTIFAGVSKMRESLSYMRGRQFENNRIQSCYENKNFSGFTWLNESHIFTCESDIKPGRVIYHEVKE